MSFYTLSEKLTELKSLTPFCFPPGRTSTLPPHGHGRAPAVGNADPADGSFTHPAEAPAPHSRAAPHRPATGTLQEQDYPFTSLPFCSKCRKPAAPSLVGAEPAPLRSVPPGPAAHQCPTPPPSARRLPPLPPAHAHTVTRPRRHSPPPAPAVRRCGARTYARAVAT